ncbi:EAL domain-containing protein [Marinicrinis lubricantis]|uniref:histidine kinase n=1 Tax=Marinicrinis lubricantis TaxID=2086470 RepID=A0ABW1IVL7_9BACL
MEWIDIRYVIWIVIACLATAFIQYYWMKKRDSASRPGGDDKIEPLQAEQVMKHMAYHDVLTDLPNRYMLQEKLEEAIENCSKSGKDAAVLYLDIDRFKSINEMMGYNTGDAFLKFAVQRIRNVIHPEDQLFRLEGDEFVVLVQGTDEEEAVELSNSIIQCFARPFYLHHYEFFLSVNVGICLYPRPGLEEQSLLHSAQAAMVYAKKQGKNRFHLLDQEHYEHLNQKSELELELYRAVERGELGAYYHPQICLETGKVIAIEVLLRWDHPQKGVIGPNLFIPLAEENGLIVPIGEHVIRQACLQMKKWLDEGSPLQFISVNISARQFLQSDVLLTVKEALKESGLPAHFLELEITESVMIEVERTERILHDLKELGVRISLDDFGTGYSSLYYLKRLPIDRLKIDRSFVQDSVNDLSDANIVRAIIAVARSLKLEVIAEGVESKEHLTFLQQYLCDQVQGYFFGEPFPAEQMKEAVDEIEQMLPMYTMNYRQTEASRLEEEFRLAKQDLMDLLRQQQGMMMKIEKVEGKFIHTLCEGDLMYRLGFVSEQIVGKELSDFLPAEKAALKLEYYERAWQGEENVLYEGSMNGIYYIASLRPVYRQGKVVEIIGSCVDITEKKQVEERLRKSEEKYRLITDNMSDLIFMIRSDGTVSYASPSFETVLGHSPAELHNQQFIDYIHPEDHHFLHKQFQHMSRTKKAIVLQFRCIDSAGEVVVLEANATPVFYTDGKLRKVVVAARDVTEQKRAEELVRKSDRLTVVGELAAGVAHEIRNPLTAIKGFIKLLENDQVKPQYFQIMMEEMDRIEMIVTELLMLAKPQALQLKPVHIRGLLSSVTALLETQAIMNNIQIQLEAEERLPVILSNSGQLKQVFINLLKNAIEAMPQGGNITLSAYASGEMLCVEVKDEGSGISQERLERIGEPFYSTKEKGVGLGLMISQKMIKQLDGQLTIESEVGKGTTVKVELPLQQR